MIFGWGGGRDVLCLLYVKRVMVGSNNWRCRLSSVILTVFVLVRSVGL